MSTRACSLPYVFAIFSTLQQSIFLFIQSLKNLCCAICSPFEYAFLFSLSSFCEFELSSRCSFHFAVFFCIKICCAFPFGCVSVCVWVLSAVDIYKYMFIICCVHHISLHWLYHHQRPNWAVLHCIVLCCVNVCLLFVIVSVVQILNLCVGCCHF